MSNEAPTDALRLDEAQRTAIEHAAMDTNADVWRHCRLAMVADGEIVGYPCFSRADMAELARLYEAAPASPLPGGGWQDISTAPKDGTEVLIYRDGWQEAPRAKWGDHDGEDDQGNSIVFGGWFMASEWFTYGCEDGFLGWNDDSTVMPTHWMPLPAAPTGEPK